MAESLYDKLGGEGVLDAAIDLFYEKVLADPELTTPLQSVPFDVLRPNHKQFLTEVLGGPANYDPTPLREAYQNAASRHGYTDDHFQAMTNHFRKAMDDLNVSPMVNIQTIMALSKRGVFY